MRKRNQLWFVFAFNVKTIKDFSTFQLKLWGLEFMGSELLKTTLFNNPGILQKKPHNSINPTRAVTCHITFI